MCEIADLVDVLFEVSWSCFVVWDGYEHVLCRVCGQLVTASSAANTMPSGTTNVFLFSLALAVSLAMLATAYGRNLAKRTSYLLHEERPFLSAGVKLRSLHCKVGTYLLCVMSPVH